MTDRNLTGQFFNRPIFVALLCVKHDLNRCKLLSVSKMVNLSSVVDLIGELIQEIGFISDTGKSLKQILKYDFNKL